MGMWEREEAVTVAGLIDSSMEVRCGLLSIWGRERDGSLCYKVNALTYFLETLPLCATTGVLANIAAALG